MNGSTPLTEGGIMMERAVAYIRVSTKSDAQLHSYDYQLEYWKKSIGKEYEFKGVYADWGISGRYIAKRTQLLKLLEDAEKQEFDAVFTKSVSRLGRNTEEVLGVVRKLRDLGIRVFFENEQIDTFDTNYELMLALACSIAEKDLVSISENQRWSYIHRFKKGEVWFGHEIFGYKVDYTNNTLIPNEEQLETVKRVYELYLDGYGMTKISQILTAEGRKNIYGEVKWSMGSVRYILSNEKYTGNSLCQKTITKNGINNYNTGQAPKYLIKGTHLGVISEEDFNKVQEMRKNKAPSNSLGKQLPAPYEFTGKVYCGICGHKYNHKINNCGKKWACAIWSCHYRNDFTKEKCDSTNIKDEVLKEKFTEAFNEYIGDFRYTDEEKIIMEDIDQLVQMEKELNALRINKLIEASDYNTEQKRIKDQIENKTRELSKVRIKGVSNKDFAKIEAFDKDKVDKFLNNVKVYKYELEFNFVGNVTIRKPYTNGKSGNKKGWNK